jgi:hypothetical protein
MTSYFSEQSGYRILPSWTDNNNYHYCYYYFKFTFNRVLSCLHSPLGLWPPRYRGFTITLENTTLTRTPLDEWSARRTDLYLTTHINHKRQTWPGRIRNLNPSKRAAAEPRFRQNGRQFRLWYKYRVVLLLIHITEENLQVPSVLPFFSPQKYDRFQIIFY